MKESHKTAAQIVLYSLSGLLVGCAVGGTLLYKVMTQDSDPASRKSANDVAAAASQETTTGAETTTTAETTTEETTTEPPPPPLDANTVRGMLSPAEALLTQEYYYTESDRFENYSEMFGRRVPFTQSAVILTYSGTVTMKIDPDAILYAVDNDAKTITVTLPEPQVASHDLDTGSVRCYDVENALFSDNSVSTYVTQLLEQKDQILRRVRTSQQMDTRCTENAKQVIGSFIQASGTAVDYSVQITAASQAPAETVPTVPDTTTAPTTALPEISEPDRYARDRSEDRDRPQDDFWEMPW
jgi:hypothetical protein